MLMISKKLKWFLAAVLFLFLMINLFGLKENYPAWMTYKNFDVAGQRDFIYYLVPGLKDTSSNKKYSFKKVHYAPLFGVIFILFPVMGLLRLWQRSKGRSLKKKLNNVSLSVKRGISQLMFFIIARLGILRVSGACPVKRSAFGVFPFINCQSCELTTGGCPLGILQMAMLNASLPLFTIAIISLSAVIFGRFICGWFCPFGFLSEIFDRFSLHRKLPRTIHYFKFVGLFLFVIILFVLLFNPLLGFLPFCAFLCPAAFFYGILPFSITTGFGSFIQKVPNVHLMMVFHVFLAFVFLYLVRKYSGWIFCMALCPLGAFLSLFNKFSLFRIVFNEKKCNKCGICKSKCPTSHDPIAEDFVSKSACIGCGTCTRVCPKKALTFSIHTLKNKKIATGNVNRKIQRMPKVNEFENSPQPPARGATPRGGLIKDKVHLRGI